MNAISFNLPIDGLIKNGAKISRSFAAGLKPPPRIGVDEWAEVYRKFPEDAPIPGDWQHSTAIYLVEIMQAISPHDPTPVVSIIKCAQSGGSASAENWMGFIADIAPGPTMYVQATITAAQQWLAEKFWPMVEATPRLNPKRGGAILPKASRDGEGSTGLRVRFKRGSYMLIAGANSAATLRQHTIKNVVEDDLDQFPDDLDKQGSPEGMVDARLTVFRRRGLSKRLKISTPTNAGASKIETADHKSDRRRFCFKCQKCGSRFLPDFKHLIWPEGKPEQAYLAAPCCGGIHQHWQKAGMSLSDGWIAFAEVDGVKPPEVMTEEEFQVWRIRETHIPNKGFSIPGIISAFVTWAEMAIGFVDSQGDINKLRTWTNLVKGEAFQLKGDAPPAEELELLREQDWGRGQVPYGPCVFTMGCDVQGDGIYWVKKGWFHGLENWTLDHGFIPGKTDIAGDGAWAGLEQVAKQTFVMPGGKVFGLEMICVDAGYNTEAAKAFCGRSAKRLAVFGRHGWMQPILGRGMALSFDRFKPKKQKRKAPGEEAYLVGTYGAKLSFYGFLKGSIEQVKKEIAGDVPEKGRGRIHFGRDTTTEYFEMITSESCVVRKKNGIPSRVWEVMAGKENHYLDCEIYNRAAAEALQLDGQSAFDWEVLRGERYASINPAQPDLLGLATAPITKTAPTPVAPESSPSVAPATPPAKAGWVPKPKGNWFARS